MPADDIRIRHGSRGHKLLLTKQCDGAQTVAVFGGVFKFQPLSGGLHLLLQGIYQGLMLPFQQKHRLLQQCMVLFLCLARPAPAVTGIHLKIQAGSVPADVPRKLF